MPPRALLLRTRRIRGIGRPAHISAIQNLYILEFVSLYRKPAPHRDTLFPLLPIIVLIPLLFILPLFAFDERLSFRIALASSAIVFLLAAYASYTGLSSGFGALSF